MICPNCPSAKPTPPTCCIARHVRAVTRAHSNRGAHRKRIRTNRWKSEPDICHFSRAHSVPVLSLPSVSTNPAHMATTELCRRTHFTVTVTVRSGPVHKYMQCACDFSFARRKNVERALELCALVVSMLMCISQLASKMHSLVRDAHASEHHHHFSLDSTHHTVR